MLQKSYNNSKRFLLSYRNQTFIQVFKGLGLDNDIKKIKTEWDAVVFGAKYNFIDKLFNSLFWPYTLFEGIIPSIVLSLNPIPNSNPNSNPN